MSGKHKTEDHHDHNHVNLNFLGQNTELIFAILSGIFWTSGFVLSFMSGTSPLTLQILFGIGIFFGGFFTLIEAVTSTLHGKFEIDFLMLVAAIGAMFLGKWGEAGLLLFLFSLGHALEHYAMQRARKSIDDLIDLVPPHATLKTANGLEEVPIEQLEIGDIIVVKPDTKIAADGIVIEGHSSVDQAAITGESIPVEKVAIDSSQELDSNNIEDIHTVFAGTFNGSGNLEVKVMKRATDSTLSRLIELVNEAEAQKSPTQLLTDKFEKYYVPLVLVVVSLLLFAYLVIDEQFSDSFYRAMTVLIAASPCALAISTPSAVLAAIAKAARNGVLIKGGGPLEELATLQVIAFDKTGTITEGKPKLTHHIAFGTFSDNELLQTAVAVESLSDHPLAKSIVKDALLLNPNLDIPVAKEIKSITGKGIKAKINGEIVHLGNRKLMKDITSKEIPEKIDEEMAGLEKKGNTVMIVHRGKKYMGLIGVMDIARPEVKPTLKKLKDLGIKHLVMLTGDNQNVADAIAKEVGISNPVGNLLPEGKVAAIEKLANEKGSVAMIGDGVNDAPAMAKSSIGIAMGVAGSDVALETADIALMSDNLKRISFAIGLGRKAKRIIKQNLWISLGMVAILVPLTLFGIAEIGPAVIAHEGSTLVVVLNALRLLAYEE